MSQHPPLPLFFVRLLLLGFITSGLHAETEQVETLKRLDGITYEQPKIRRVEDGKIVLQHRGGFATVPAGFFSDDDLKKIGLDPADFPELESQREEAAMFVGLYQLKREVNSFQITRGVFETIKTAEIEGIDPVSILVVTDGVPRRIPIENLPRNIQERLNYDPNKAAAYLEAREKARQAGLAAAAKQEEAEAKRRAELEKARAAEARKQQQPPPQPPSRTNSPFERSNPQVFQ